MQSEIIIPKNPHINIKSIRTFHRHGCKLNYDYS